MGLLSAAERGSQHIQQHDTDVVARERILWFWVSQTSETRKTSSGHCEWKGYLIQWNFLHSTFMLVVGQMLRDPGLFLASGVIGLIFVWYTENAVAVGLPSHTDKVAVNYQGSVLHGFGLYLSCLT